MGNGLYVDRPLPSIGKGMITYHPAIDVNHAAFRIVKLTMDLTEGSDSPSYSLLQLLDFYVSFPSLIDRIRLPQNLRRIWRSLEKPKQPYENIGSPKTLFFGLGHIQKAAMRALISKGILEKSTFVAGRLRIAHNTTIPDAVNAAFADAERAWRPFYGFLVDSLSAVSLDGKDGLKARTGLMEFRYDPD